MSEKIMLCENSISSDQSIFYTYIIGGSTLMSEKIMPCENFISSDQGILYIYYWWFHCK